MGYFITGAIVFFFGVITGAFLIQSAINRTLNTRDKEL